MGLVGPPPRAPTNGRPGFPFGFPGAGGGRFPKARRKRFLLRNSSSSSVMGLVARCGDVTLQRKFTFFCSTFFFTCSPNTQMTAFSLISKVRGHQCSIKLSCGASQWAHRSASSQKAPTNGSFAAKIICAHVVAEPLVGQAAATADTAETSTRCATDVFVQNRACSFRAIAPVWPRPLEHTN